MVFQITGCRQYEGRFADDDVGGLDTAHRILADHARMITVAIADGIFPDERQILHINYNI